MFKHKNTTKNRITELGSLPKKWRSFCNFIEIFVEFMETGKISFKQVPVEALSPKHSRSFVSLEICKVFDGNSKPEKVYFFIICK